MSDAFLQARLAATERLIVLYEEAIEAIVSGGVQSYELDTGQTQQKVTKLTLGTTQNSLDALYNRRATIQQRMTGQNTMIGRPGW